MDRNERALIRANASWVIRDNPSSYVLKGHDVKAQGAGMGETPSAIAEALKGRNARGDQLCRPFRAPRCIDAIPTQAVGLGYHIAGPSALF